MTEQEKRSWLYAIAWLGGGVAAGGFTAWLIWILAFADWQTGTEAQRIGVLGQLSLGMVVLMGLVILGLSIRNAIRNIKGTAGPVSLEASGGDDNA